MNKLHNKKYLIFFQFILLISLGCVNNNSMLCSEGVYINDVFLYNDQPYTGKCLVYFEQNPEMVQEVRSFKKGLMHGNWIQYHGNGNVFYDSYAKNGEIHGKYSSFHPNGNKADEGKMKKGYKNGVWEYYNENGTLYKKELYRNQQKIDEEYY